MAHDFGAKLRLLRRARRIRQTQLAAALGLASQAHVSNLEAGRREPSIELILRVAGYFGVSTDYLLRDDRHVGSECGPDPRDVVGASRSIRESTIEYTTNARASSTCQLLGPKVKHLRRQREMSQTELAHRVGLQTQSHISYLERGRKEPSLDLVIRVADFFGVRINYLLCDDIPIDAADDRKRENS
jgi:transcriptional regulator with XRE-family HTH domain